MLEGFVHAAPATRVVFGHGTLAQLPDEAGRLGITRAMVLSTPQQAAQASAAADALGRVVASLFAGAAMHTPVNVTEVALEQLWAVGADGIVSFGGGSTTGLGKALAVRTGLRHLCVPTTYAGSEMTPILGETDAGVKRTRTDPKILPDTVVYDVDQTLGLPPGTSAASGLNAIAHAVEALYARDTDPVVQLMAAEGIRSLHAALPAVVRDGRDQDARADALYGAWLCATCLGRTSMALHHKLCHVLGGTFNLPHAETHAAVLPHALGYNAPAVPDAVRRIGTAVGSGDPAAALFDLNATLGGPTALRNLGMPEDGIEHALRLTLENPYWNPRPLEKDALRGLLRAAWRGERPGGASHDAAAA